MPQNDRNTTVGRFFTFCVRGKWLQEGIACHRMTEALLWGCFSHSVSAGSSCRRASPAPEWPKHYCRAVFHILCPREVAMGWFLLPQNDRNTTVGRFFTFCVRGK